MHPILFILKKNGLDDEVYKDLINLLNYEKLKIVDSKFICLKDKEKFCHDLYTDKFVKYKKHILKTYNKSVVAVIIDIGKREQVHLRIKRYIRKKYGFNVIHCSDNSDEAIKEIKVLLEQNKALFYDDHVNRKYEYKLLKMI